MTDRAVDTEPLRVAWRSAGRRVAVAGGSLVALIALLRHVPLTTASLRGGVTFVALRLIAAAGLLALERALAASPDEPTRGGEAH